MNAIGIKQVSKDEGVDYSKRNQRDAMAEFVDGVGNSRKRESRMALKVLPSVSRSMKWYLLRQGS